LTLKKRRRKQPLKEPIFMFKIRSAELLRRVGFGAIVAVVFAIPVHLAHYPSLNKQEAVVIWIVSYWVGKLSLLVLAGAFLAESIVMHRSRLMVVFWAIAGVGAVISNILGIMMLSGHPPF
jgi:hypothetical protein